jgi:hypothetical protein
MLDVLWLDEGHSLLVGACRCSLDVVGLLCRLFLDLEPGLFLEWGGGLHQLTLRGADRHVAVRGFDYLNKNGQIISSKEGYSFEFLSVPQPEG